MVAPLIPRSEAGVPAGLLKDEDVRMEPKWGINRYVRETWPIYQKTAFAYTQPVAM